MTIIEDLTPPPFITYAIPFFFLLMGVELLVGKVKNKTYYSMSDSIADLSTGILSQLSGIFLKALSLLGYLYIYNHPAADRRLRLPTFARHPSALTSKFSLPQSRELGRLAKYRQLSSFLHLTVQQMRLKIQAVSGVKHYPKRVA